MTDIDGTGPTGNAQKELNSNTMTSDLGWAQWLHVNSLWQFAQETSCHARQGAVMAETNSNFPRMLISLTRPINLWKQPCLFVFKHCVLFLKKILKAIPWLFNWILSYEIREHIFAYIRNLAYLMGRLCVHGSVCIHLQLEQELTQLHRVKHFSMVESSQDSELWKKLSQKWNC